MDLSEKVKRYAEIKAEISELKSEADGIEADILKASEADLRIQSLNLLSTATMLAMQSQSPTPTTLSLCTPQCLRRSLVKRTATL